MQVFVTGATGWVGSVVVRELVAGGHRVRGLVRSADKAAALAAAGAEVVPGSLDDLEMLAREAAAADAVVHTAFNHDFSRYAENAAEDARAIAAMGAALEGSARPLLVTSGLAGFALGRPATEADVPVDVSTPRRSEPAARALAARGVRAATVRLPPSVHGAGDQGFVPILIAIARARGVSAYVGDGANRWAAVHRQDAGRVYVRALETGAGEAAYHAVAEEGIAFREIAAAIGARLGLPVEPRGPEHFGWFAPFAGLDMSAASARTRECLDWHPAGPGLLADLADPDYQAA